MIKHALLKMAYIIWRIFYSMTFVVVTLHVSARLMLQTVLSG